MPRSNVLIWRWLENGVNTSVFNAIMFPVASQDCITIAKVEASIEP